MGAVDLGMAVLGIETAIGSTRYSAFMTSATFGARDYRRHERLAMEELAAGPEIICRRILEPLFEVISINGYDPYGGARL